MEILRASEANRLAEDYLAAKSIEDVARSSEDSECLLDVLEAIKRAAEYGELCLCYPFDFKGDVESIEPELVKLGYEIQWEDHYRHGPYVRLISWEHAEPKM